ncbi:MAG: sterol desaturase family protein [Kofleriaceae bacterium]|nr:sterol desaturase family protein [Kofleriaceae bacterium]
MSSIVLYSIPAFLILLGLELWWARRHVDDPAIVGYERRDTAASLSMGIGNVIVSAGTKLFELGLYVWVWEHRIWDVPAALGAWSWLVLLFAEDLCYYGFHRSHHEIRLLWAAHVNHHSSTHYNLSTALRQSFTTPLTGPLFWVPLALVGFPPWMIFTAKAWSLLYQFWLHTEAIPTLGPLEWIMNTPSHHRVHHGANLAYLDRNHAGIFIIWDRLLGTFEPERERVVYGLTKNLETFNPLRIGFHEFAAIGRDVRRAPGLLAKLRYVVGPPGWSHDGSTLTADQMRAAAATTPPPGPPEGAPAIS